jgi:mono/diheme cytochrome c family protein
MENFRSIGLILFSCLILVQCDLFNSSGSDVEELDPELVKEGKEIFRYDAFGDEAFWSGVLHIDKAILGEKNGGYGPGVSPSTALSVGLKVDAQALSDEVVSAINAGKVDLDDPKTTLTLLKQDAVVGIKGTFNENEELASVGITCALCHSTVDNSFASGIGKRLDGWPNRDLNVGAIISLTDNAQPIADLLHVNEQTLRTVLNGWGPGKFNAGLMVDGIALRPDGEIAANLLPAAYGLTKESKATYTGWGDISYWNAFVANIEMHGIGNFSDSRLNNVEQFPIAAENGFNNITNKNDQITSKLPALLEYQVSLSTPIPPEGSFDADAAERGEDLFIDKARCATCHTPPTFSDSERRLHTPEEIGIDSFEADRSPTGKYRTTPLKGIWARSKGGYYHDGRFATLNEVVEHYNSHFKLNLSVKEKNDLIQYLKSL